MATAAGLSGERELAPVVGLGELEQARFVDRPNRFAAVVERQGVREFAHVPNTGRMSELLVPGATVYISPSAVVLTRKPRYDLTLVEHRGRLVSVDSRLPPRLLVEGIGRGRVMEFDGYDRIDREVRLGRSRVDLLLSREGSRLFVETKSVNKVEDGAALFPDAATARGTKHLQSLLAAVESGHRAAAVFVVQRSDAERLVPDEQSDPMFCETLRTAVKGGIEALAYNCSVTRHEIAICSRVPVVL